MREEITREVRTWNWVKTKAQQTQGCRTHESSTKGDVYNVYIITLYIFTYFIYVLFIITWSGV